MGGAVDPETTPKASGRPVIIILGTTVYDSMSRCLASHKRELRRAQSSSFWVYRLGARKTT